MPAAKVLELPPRELAATLKELLKLKLAAPLDGVGDKSGEGTPPFGELGALADDVSVAGPGFLNIKLKDSFVLNYLEHEQFFQPLLEGWKPASNAFKNVVDMSSPNLAKEMHIGHLRSSNIGDSVARIHKHQGENVIRQNHVGDWGTQFGMLLAHLQSLDDAQSAHHLADLECFYREARQRFDEEPGFADTARRYVVALQNRDPEVYSLWKKYREVSLAHCDEVYRRLNIALTPEDVRGESEYEQEIPKVIAALEEKRLLKDSHGALCVFFDENEIKGAGDHRPPLIIQKSDKGYLYATTDLAAIRHRKKKLNADRILYFVDSRQSLHFKQVFKVAGKAGFINEDHLRYFGFGMIQGKNGKPLQTREGGVIKLIDLLDEAQKRAAKLLTSREQLFSPDELEKISRVVGIGAIKYADLCKDRTKDYIFDWDEMLSFQGNTGPYLQYAYTRIYSLFERAELNIETPLAFKTESMLLQVPPARVLALHLLEFSNALFRVKRNGKPHILCTYLYQLASKFSLFYEYCPILTAEAHIRNDRLRLVQLTAACLKKGLDLLGIEVVERM